jgi:mRNA-degrading endonuclease RelE of RelBE toxin-antitoxin system
MNWRINVHRDAARQLEAIPPDRRKRIFDDIRELADDPFRGLVKALKGKKFKGLYRRVSGRYRIIFEPIYSTRTVEVVAVFLRNEGTYR